jgi:acyl-CoA thioesterase I
VRGDQMLRLTLRVGRRLVSSEHLDRAPDPDHYSVPMKTILLIFLMVCFASAQQPTVDPRPVIVAFGDSLTSGYGVPPGLGYPEQLQKKLDAGGYAYRVVNMGLPGDTTGSGRSRISRALALNPAIVILELGGNDISSGLTLTQTGTNLEEMIRLFRIGGITVVLAQVDSELSKVFGELTRKYGLTSIPSFLDGVEDNPKLTIADGLHPNAEGYTIITNTVMKAIEPLLKKGPLLR